MMTLEQAEQAARNRWPVSHRGVNYMCIEDVGRHYRVNGEPVEYVVLRDRYSNSVVRVSPQEVNLIGGVGDG